MADIKKQITSVLAGLGYPDELISIEYPAHAKFGDYSTNLAMNLSRKDGRNPLEIAEEIIAKLQGDESIRVTFSKVEAVKPGFINFFLSKEYLQSALEEIEQAGDGFGKNDLGQGQKVQVEFISANPTGPLTLANGRGGAYGDALSNILELSNYEVEREYYINDAGNQIRSFGLSLLAAADLIPDDESYYKGSYIKEWSEKNSPVVYRLKSEPEVLGRTAAKDYLENHIKPSLKKFGISFGRFTSEYNDIRSGGLVDKALQIFTEQKAVYENDHALWFATTRFGDEKDRVLVTSEGEQTYLMVDAGHYLETVQRGFKQKVNILGADHHGYVKRIQAAAQLVGLKQSEIIIMQLVKIIEDGKEVRMSKRRGQFVLLDDLIAEVGKDVARWFFLTRSPESHIEIDLKLAKERSKKNPVFYVQYAHTRLNSICEKAGKLNMSREDHSQELTDAESQLIGYLLRWPELVENIAQNHQAHNLTVYCYELADRIQKFYEDSRVIEGEAVNAFRFKLAKVAQQTLANVLSVLGVEAPKQM